MDCSNNFNNKYHINDESKCNLEMKEIIRRTDQVLSPYFIDNKHVQDREILYETVYGYKLMIADKYGFDMDRIYKNISCLKEVKLENENSEYYKENPNALGYFSANGNGSFNSNNKCFSIISILKNENYYDVKEDENIVEIKYRETLTHELLHLFSQEYIKNEDLQVEKLGKCGIEGTDENQLLDEIINQKLTLDILNKLGYNSQCLPLKKNVDNNYLNNIEIHSYGIGYASISQTGNIVHEIFDKTIYEEKFEHTGDFMKVFNMTYNNPNNFITSINSLCEKTPENISGYDYIKVYKGLSNAIFQKIDDENLNIADYLNIMNNINREHKCMLQTIDTKRVPNDTGRGVKQIEEVKISINILDALSASKEIEHFYKEFNKNFNLNDLERQINPFERSKDCTNFLIIMQSLKTNGIDNDINKFNNLTWKEISRNDDEIILSYKYDGSSYFVHAKKDLNTGLLEVHTDEQFCKKPSFFQRFQNKESYLKHDNNFEFVSKFSKISDYSDLMIKYGKSHDDVVIHATSTLDLEAFKEHIKYVNIDKVTDNENNNLFHILAQNTNFSNDYSIFQEVGKLNKNNANVLLNTKNNEGYSPVDIAFINGNFSFINNLYKAGLNISNIENYDNDMRASKPLIHNLQEHMCYSAVEKLIRNNYNIEKKDNNGDTIIHILMTDNNPLFDIENRRNIINALMNTNININIENNENLTPLMSICNSTTPSFSRIKYLCDGLSADPNYTNKDNIAAIHYLLDNSVRHEFEGYSATLEALIKYGKDVDVNILGKAFNHKEELIYPIQISTGADYFDAFDKITKINYENITLLIKHGADINQTNDKLPSALQMAHLIADENMFKAFIDGGTKLNNLNIQNSELPIPIQLEIIDYATKKEKEINIDFKQQIIIKSVNENKQNQTHTDLKYEDDEKKMKNVIDHGITF